MIRMNPEGRTLLNGMNADLSNVLYVLSFQTMLCVLKTTFRSVEYQATKKPSLWLTAESEQACQTVPQ